MKTCVYKKDPYVNVYSGFICRSQNIETNQISINGGEGGGGRRGNDEELTTDAQRQAGKI